MLNKTAKIILLVSLLGSLFGCSTNNAGYPAKEEHLKDIILTEQENSDNVLIFQGNTLTIRNNPVNISPDMDPNDLEDKETTEKIYQDITIKTKEDRYLITNPDGLSMTLKRIGERIIVDENDNRYSTDKFFD